MPPVYILVDKTRQLLSECFKSVCIASFAFSFAICCYRVRCVSGGVKLGSYYDLGLVLEWGRLDLICISHPNSKNEQAS
jgi:hypothetical protein